jgi:hypothetical protein
MPDRKKEGAVAMSTPKTENFEMICNNMGCRYIKPAGGAVLMTMQHESVEVRNLDEGMPESDISEFKEKKLFKIK